MAPSPGATVLAPRAAWLAPSKRVPAGEAIGRVAGETLSPYPPGVPVVLPGERLTHEIVEFLSDVAASGGVIRGAVDALETVGVLAEPVEADRPAYRRAHRPHRRERGATWSR